jgi:hypothetical protein
MVHFQFPDQSGDTAVSADIKRYVQEQLAPLLVRIAALEAQPELHIEEWSPTRAYAFGMQARWGRYIWFAVESSIGAEPGKTASWDWDFEVEPES